MISNALSISRAFLGPLVLYCLINNFEKTTLLVIFLAGITDFLDGYIARKLNKNSKLGIIIDPICDKIFCTFLFVGLYPRIPIFIFIMVILRDLLILIGSLFLKNNNLVPLFVGKVHTALLFVLSISVITNLYTEIFYTLIIATTMLSIYGYTKKLIKDL